MPPLTRSVQMKKKMCVTQSLSVFNLLNPSCYPSAYRQQMAFTFTSVYRVYASDVRAHMITK
eukprot:5201845-Pleurochrysis_carterae.AAC.1